MRFPMPNLPCEFEIPDDWIAESGIDGFTPSTLAFRSAEGSRSVPLTEIVPAPRQNGYPKDWRGFEKSRLVRALRGFVADELVPPVPLIQLPDENHLVRLSYRFLVRDGYH